MSERARWTYGAPPPDDEIRPGSQFCPPLTTTQEQSVKTAHHLPPRVRPFSVRGEGATQGAGIQADRESANTAKTEPGREPLDYLDFGTAFRRLIAGDAISRRGWTDVRYLQTQYPDENSANTDPYVVVHCEGRREPWAPSQADLFAIDWCVVRILGTAIVFGVDASAGAIVMQHPGHSG